MKENRQLADAYYYICKNEENFTPDRYIDLSVFDRAHHATGIVVEKPLGFTQ